MTNKTTQELKEIRHGITEVDNKMALLFKERMALVKKSENIRRLTVCLYMILQERLRCFRAEQSEWMIPI